MEENNNNVETTNNIVNEQIPTTTENVNNAQTSVEPVATPAVEESVVQPTPETPVAPVVEQQPKKKNIGLIVIIVVVILLVIAGICFGAKLLFNKQTSSQGMSDEIKENVEYALNLWADENYIIDYDSEYMNDEKFAYNLTFFYSIKNLKFKDINEKGETVSGAVAYNKTEFINALKSLTGKDYKEVIYNQKIGFISADTNYVYGAYATGHSVLDDQFEIEKNTNNEIVFDYFYKLNCDEDNKCDKHDLGTAYLKYELNKDNTLLIKSFVIKYDIKEGDNYYPLNSEEDLRNFKEKVKKYEYDTVLDELSLTVNNQPTSIKLVKNKALEDQCEDPDCDQEYNYISINDSVMFKTIDYNYQDEQGSIVKDYLKNHILIIKDNNNKDYIAYYYDSDGQLDGTVQIFDTELNPIYVFSQAESLCDSSVDSKHQGTINVIDNNLYINSAEFYKKAIIIDLKIKDGKVINTVNKLIDTKSWCNQLH